MFFSRDQLRESLLELEKVHPIFGITYLVCKEAHLPVGTTIEFHINNLEADFLRRYYRPYKESRYYFRVSRLSDPNKHWVSERYASSTLQSARTRGDLSHVFEHPMRTSQWGWHPKYVDLLRSYLDDKKLNRLPAFHLAVWLYHQRDWPRDTSPRDVVHHLFESFHIGREEQQKLFDFRLHAPKQPMFRDSIISWRELRDTIGSPPDAHPEEGGTLSSLELKSVGPTDRLVFKPAERLNIITGDNGLGKSFLLDCAWWALAGSWPSLPALPRRTDRSVSQVIAFEISGEHGPSGRTTALYDSKSQRWKVQARHRRAIPGLLVYARVDGSFAVWDPARLCSDTDDGQEGDRSSGHLMLSNNQVWDGIEEQSNGRTRVRSNGLLRDWITWQSKPDKSPFPIFTSILNRLSPPAESDIGRLQPGEPTRLPNDAREIPTLRHPYGEVPILHASAGIRRIVALAYLMVWAWEEHKAQCEAARRPLEKRMVILVDEMESHLHPKWQRAILPALLGVAEELDSRLQIQFLVATHSPIVLASVEAVFNEEIDKLFHLDLATHEPSMNQVILRELEFFRRGTADQWLMSEALEETPSRAVEAVKAIEAAKALQLERRADPAEVQAVHSRLTRLLAEDDDFWPRWVYFAEQHGVRA